MLVRPEEEDRPALLAYLGREPACNVFTIGDIENFGLRADFQDVWAEPDGRGSFRCVVLRYFQNHIVYAHGPGFDRQGVSDLLRPTVGSGMLSGKEPLVRALAPGLGLHRIRKQGLLALRPGADLPVPREAPAAAFARQEDLDEVLALQARIEEFRQYIDGTEGVRHNFTSGTGRTTLLRAQGRVVSTASSAAENSASAMLIGVATEKAFRHKGHATRCVALLCRALLDEDKTVCLFYDNPEAGRLYRVLGFQPAGRWAVASK